MRNGYNTCRLFRTFNNSWRSNNRAREAPPVMPEAAAIATIGVPVAGPRRLAPPRQSTKLIAVRAEPPDDGMLMLRYATGDADAFRELYSRHRAPLWRFVLRNLRDTAATADVFQEIWARVIAHRENYVRTAKFTTWLYRIAHNCCVDHWRRTGRAARREHPSGEQVLAHFTDGTAPTPDEEAQSAERAAALQAALQQLPAEQRTAFLMYVEGGLGLAEIAAATGVGLETAKSRLRYAVARLRSVLGESQS
jgi:RNA polymerase sigma-70 factor (ECF subfamily)